MRNFLATSAKTELQLSFLLEKKRKIAWDSISTLGMARWASGWAAKATLGTLGVMGYHGDSELQEAGMRVSQELMRTHDAPPPNSAHAASKPTIACLVTSPILHVSEIKSCPNLSHSKHLL